VGNQEFRIKTGLWLLLWSPRFDACTAGTQGAARASQGEQKRSSLPCRDRQQQQEFVPDGLQ